MSLNGIDISGYQAVAAASEVPADFVIVKATEGNTYTSKSCDGQVQGALRARRLVGVYHFASGKPGAVAEADYFVNAIRGYVGKAILVLDWEAGAVAKGPAYAKAFLDRVKALTGVRPMIYMSTSVVNGWDWSAVKAADYGLWAAAYGSNPRRTAYEAAGAPSVKHWGTPALFQYGSNFHAGGHGPLDIDIFYGDRKAWAAYATPNGKAPVVTPAPAPAAKPATSSGSLAEDGLLGPATIRRMQKDLGTPQDGVLSRPSAMVKALQRRLNAQGFRDWDGKPLVVDGLGFGHGVKTRTVYAFQRYIGSTADGILSKPSAAVKALQRRLNRGHI